MLIELQALQERAIREQQESEAAGVPALQRLIQAAQGTSGQPQHIRRFLLGLCDGPNWPLGMTWYCRGCGRSEGFLADGFERRPADARLYSGLSVNRG